jgi:hypothetical protein
LVRAQEGVARQEKSVCIGHFQKTPQKAVEAAVAVNGHFCAIFMLGMLPPSALALALVVRQVLGQVIPKLLVETPPISLALATLAALAQQLPSGHIFLSLLALAARQ